MVKNFFFEKIFLTQKPRKTFFLGQKIVKKWRSRKILVKKFLGQALASTNGGGAAAAAGAAGGYQELIW